MRIATKLGLAAWLEKEAADQERLLERAPYVSPIMRERMLASINNNLAAAFAIRRLEIDQEIAMLEWQVGGPDGSGIESYENPITVLRPAVKTEPPPRNWWGKMLDTLEARDPWGV